MATQSTICLNHDSWDWHDEYDSGLRTIKKIKVQSSKFKVKGLRPLQ